jgi:hypothetical protein
MTEPGLSRRPVGRVEVRVHFEWFIDLRTRCAAREKAATRNQAGTIAHLLSLQYEDQILTHDVGISRVSPVPLALKDRQAVVLIKGRTFLAPHPHLFFGKQAERMIRSLAPFPKFL